jgi:hypothetical protein
MKVEKPLTDEVADFLSAQVIRTQDSNPLCLASGDELFDYLRVLEVIRHQANQADIAMAMGGILYRTAVDVPTGSAQNRDELMTIVARINN